jgi:hypothetical protein
MKVLVTLLAALALTAAASAKDGVVAKIENPAALRSSAGTKVALVWTLRAGKQPFSASGVYARVNGREASATELRTGRFRAWVTIPSGGVRTLVIALKGWSSGPDGTHRGDWRFPIVNEPTR